jgi:hypothetical protein
MSAKPYQITCPHCNGEQTVPLYDKLDPGRNPELKAALFENRLNRISCEHCQASFRIDLPLLYTDLKKGIIIHWIPLQNQTLEQIQQDFRESTEMLKRETPAGMQPPRLQLVLTRVELVERIYMLEAGFDERLIEQIKYAIYEKNPQRVPAQSCHLLFCAQDSDENRLNFAVQEIDSGTFREVLQYDRAQYNRLAQQAKNEPALLTGFFPGAYKNARLLFMERQSASK